MPFTKQYANKRNVILVLLGVLIMVFVLHNTINFTRLTEEITRLKLKLLESRSPVEMAVNRSNTATADAPRITTAVDCVTPLDPPSWTSFFDLVEQQQPCDKTIMVGGSNRSSTHDGGKFVCMDPPVAPREDDKCLVLSFGINNEFSFDDAMANRGCTVYAFDPTMKASDHKRGERIFFHSLGLSEKKGLMPYQGKRVPVESYRGVLEHIGHLNSTIDYLKIDIEGSEIGFFENVLNEDQNLLKSVKQIGMEIHPGHDTVRRDKLWTYIHRLRCLGFKQVHSEINLARRNSYQFNNRRVSACYELVWVNKDYY